MADGLSPSEVARFQELGKSGFLQTLEQNAKSLTSPFYWYDPDQLIGRRIVQGGTICFVRTGQVLLGLSAAHVHRACMKLLTTNPGMACQIGGHSFDPEAGLIDISDELDLVTYRLSQVQVSAAGGYVHSPSDWPPKPVGEGFVVAGGWPWRMTSSTATQSTHEFLHFIGRLSDASEMNLVMQIFKSSSVPWGQRSLPPGMDLGGMSGGPLYALRSEPLIRLELVGVMYEYHQPFEAILARPISKVKPDGTLVG